MDAKELIEKLQKVPSGAKVKIWDFDEDQMTGYFREATEVEPVNIGGEQTVFIR